MNQILQRQTITFVVHVWAEYLEQDPPIWRGEILLPDGSQRIYFQTLEEIIMFIDAQSLYLKTTKELKHGG